MNFNETAHNLSFGYYRPHFPKDSFEAGWNLISQREAINKALREAFEAGKKSAQQGAAVEYLLGNLNNQDRPDTSGYDISHRFGPQSGPQSGQQP